MYLYTPRTSPSKMQKDANGHLFLRGRRRWLDKVRGDVLLRVLSWKDSLGIKMFSIRILRAVLSYLKIYLNFRTFLPFLPNFERKVFQNMEGGEIFPILFFCFSFFLPNNGKLFLFFQNLSFLFISILPN